jgi:hypothetical protein
MSAGIDALQLRQQGTHAIDRVDDVGARLAKDDQKRWRFAC